MHIKLQCSELNRMMKTIIPCTDTHGLSRNANICIQSTSYALVISATNGVMSAEMRTPVIGTDEVFCVDGQTFAKVVGANTGTVEIITDDKSCFVKGAGRTRIPIVGTGKIEINHAPAVDGLKQAIISSSNFVRCFNNVAYSLSSDQTTRPVLTGVLVESDGSILRMTAIDGFQMSVDHVPCTGQAFSAIVPGAFMKLVSQSVAPDTFITFYVCGNMVTVGAEVMMLSSTLLAGQYPDVNRIMPSSFKIECMTDGGELMNALKSGSVVSSKQNLVKLEIGADSIRIANNGDNADFEADVPCCTTGLDQGSTLKIAFNQKYFMNAVNAVSDDDVVLKFNSSLSPCVAQKKTENTGDRLVLPVRVQG